MRTGGTTANRFGRSSLTSRTGRDGRDRRAALALAGWAAALALAGLGLRRAGIPETVIGGALAVSVAAGYASFVGHRLKQSGRNAAWAVGWGAAILIASAVPTLVSVFPGHVVADASVRSPGDVVELPASVQGGLRVLVSAVLPERAFVAFSLRQGGTVIEGTLSRGVQWSGTGEERRHHFEERSSVLLAGEASPGARRLVLERVAGDPVPLRVRVFVPPFPLWVVSLVSAMVMVAFGLLHHRQGRERPIVTAAFVAVCSGLAAAAVATPEAALGAVAAGGVLGALVGVPLAVAVGAAGRAIIRTKFGRVRPTWRNPA